MYPLDQENLLEDDVIEFVQYYLSLTKKYLQILGQEDIYSSLQEFGYIKDLLKQLKSCKDSKLFFEKINEFEQKLPYGKDIVKCKSLTEKCEYLYDRIAEKQVNMDDYSDVNKVVRKRQRELDNQYEELFPIAKKYKECVGELNNYSLAMTDSAKLMAVYHADTTGVSLNEFKEKVKEAYGKILENVKKSRTSCFEKLQDYYIKFHENLLAQKNLEQIASL